MSGYLVYDRVARLKGRSGGGRRAIAGIGTALLTVALGA